MDDLKIDLLDTDFSTRLDAVEEIGKRGINGDTSSFQPLIGVLIKGDQLISGYAAKALGEIGDERAILPLVKRLMTVEPIDDYYEPIEEAIFRFGNKAIHPLIDELMNDSINNMHSRERAAIVLSEIGNTAAVTPLIQILSKKERYIEDWALTALLSIKDDRVIPELSYYLKNQRFSKRAIDYMLDLNWRPENMEDTITMFMALRDRNELEARWEDTKKTLIKDIASSNILVVSNATNIIIGIGNEEMLPEVHRVLWQRENGNTLAACLLNCGVERLEQLAVGWYTGNGYRITHEKTSINYASAKWGEL